jgi:hypothetical protein
MSIGHVDGYSVALHVVSVAERPSWLGGSPSPASQFCEAVVFVNGMAAGFLCCGVWSSTPKSRTPGVSLLALQLTLMTDR